jgi:DNA invertase Pin-like site-specific DNA recombinase
MLTIMGGIAEFERGLIRKRCEEGIARAKRKDTRFGRPLFSTPANADASPNAMPQARRWRSLRVSTLSAKPPSGDRFRVESSAPLRSLAVMQ